MRNEFDNQIEGQMDIFELLETPERLFAVSRVFARARKEMNLAEQKTFVYALTEMNFKEDAKTNTVYLDKKMLAKVIGIDSDIDHLSANLYRAIKELPKHSYIEISDRDLDYYESGTIITRIAFFKNRVRIKFEDSYLKLFTGLSSDYLTMWSGDIFQMQSIRSVQFYELLRQETDTRLEINSIGLGVKALKEMFNVPRTGKGSYMRDNGHFNRDGFEKKVIDPLCEDLKECKMINLVLQPDGKYYEKVKSGNRVLGYKFYWTFSAYPAVADAEEVKQIQERVDKDPEILKVAKDILKGEKKTSKKSSVINPKNKDIDLDAIVSMIQE